MSCLNELRIIAPIRTRLICRAIEATWSFGRSIEGNNDTQYTSSWVTMSDDVDAESLGRMGPTRFTTDCGALLVSHNSSSGRLALTLMIRNTQYIANPRPMMAN